MNIIQIFKQFPGQKDCIEHLEKIRWNGNPVCPYCQCQSTYKLKEENRFRHHCNNRKCGKSFSVTIGTIFHNSKLPMQKWFLAISLILNAKKGISSRQLARDLELPVKTAWSVGMRVREGMKYNGVLLSGVIEMDEAYIGGKPRKRGKKDDNAILVSIIIDALECQVLQIETLKSENQQLAESIAENEVKINFHRTQKLQRGKRYRVTFDKKMDID